jgi:aryl-alcohol dehydrogenase-like predicted oxidoreductase
VEYRPLGRTGINVSQLCLGAMMLGADRIDQIVPPGSTVNVADNLWNRNTTALEAASRRR